MHPWCFVEFCKTLQIDQDMSVTFHHTTNQENSWGFGTLKGMYQRGSGQSIHQKWQNVTLRSPLPSWWFCSPSFRKFYSSIWWIEKVGSQIVSTNSFSGPITVSLKLLWNKVPCPLKSQLQVWRGNGREKRRIRTTALPPRPNLAKKMRNARS